MRTGREKMKKSREGRGGGRRGAVKCAAPARASDPRRAQTALREERRQRAQAKCCSQYNRDVAEVANTARARVQIRARRLGRDEHASCTHTRRCEPRPSLHWAARRLRSHLPLTTPKSLMSFFTKVRKHNGDDDRDGCPPSGKGRCASGRMRADCTISLTFSPRSRSEYSLS